MNALYHLEPQAVWAHFAAICAIPHGSGNTAALADHIEAFACEKGIACRRDAAGNLVLTKPAAPGYEDHPGVILQGHIDMVAVKEPDCPQDLERDGIEPLEQEGWVSARGTSLGADNGIAVAMALAVLEDNRLPHPPLTVLLTNDEEIGMLGAVAADLSDITARRLINLDSEEEGILTVSCAGGLSVLASLPLSREEREGLALTLALKNLSGGHSGVEIHKGRGNAIKLLTAVLRQCLRGLPGGILELSGGAKDNAIPTDAVARLLIDPAQLPAWQTLCKALEAELRDRCKETDPYLELYCTTGAVRTASVLTEESAARLLDLAGDTPDGVIARTAFDPDLVQTSLNLGVLNAVGDTAALTWSVRSSVSAEKAALTEELRQAVEKAGAVFSVSGAYEGWEYREDSPLRETLAATWQELSGVAPTVQGIHAGLECGPLCGKLPGLDAVSLGPEMEGVHTTGERVRVASVKRTWEFLVASLAKL